MLKRIPYLAIILMTGVSLGTARRSLGLLLPLAACVPEASRGTGRGQHPGGRVERCAAASNAQRFGRTAL